MKTALDGVSAITIAEEFQPHIVILDVMMREWTALRSAGC